MRRRRDLVHQHARFVRLRVRLWLHGAGHGRRVYGHQRVLDLDHLRRRTCRLHKFAGFVRVHLRAGLRSAGDRRHVR